MTNKKTNHKQDAHYQKAKKEGYRARSAYKLLEIQKRYNIFKRAFYILDLGCAPGSWLQVSKSFAEENLIKYNDQHYHRNEYKIMGVDVKKVSPIENVIVLQIDFTNAEFQEEVKSYFHDKIDLMLSDASIHKSGNKFTDHINQINLCYKILDLAKDYLKFKGVLVMKTFQGSDFNKLVSKTKPLFRIMRSFKPISSKKKSNEIYLVGMQKK
ncbi:MAG: SAM-dependent methyltransferase [Candidatus Hermodarchaeota archaeon]